MPLDWSTIEDLTALGALAYEPPNESDSRSIAQKLVGTGWRYVTREELGLDGVAYDSKFDGYGYFDGTLGAAGYVAINEITHQVAIVFRGTEGFANVADVTADVVLLIGSLPLTGTGGFGPLIQGVTHFTTTVGSAGLGATVLTAGHSLGGTIAELVWSLNPTTVAGGVGFGSPGLSSLLVPTDDSFLHIARSMDAVGRVRFSLGNNLQIDDDNFGLADLAAIGQASHNHHLYASQVDYIASSPISGWLPTSVDERVHWMSNAGGSYSFADYRYFDVIAGFINYDAAFGGSGQDTFNMASAPVGVLVDGGGGTDYLTGSGLGDRLAGGGGIDYLRGAGGNDTLYGGTSGDFYSIGVGEGFDTIDDRGGSGVDTIRFYSSATFGAIDFNWFQVDGADLLVKAYDGGNLVLDIRIKNMGSFAGGIEHFDLYAGAGDTLTQSWDLVDVWEQKTEPAPTYNPTPPTFSGDTTPLHLVGNGDVDDIFVGGAGDDLINGWGGNDIIFGGAGNDWIAPDFFPGPIEMNWADGGPGIDTLHLELIDALPNKTFSAAMAASSTGFTYYNGAHYRNFEKFELLGSDYDDQVIFDSNVALGSYWGARGGNDRLIMNHAASSAPLISASTYAPGNNDFLDGSGYIFITGGSERIAFSEVESVTLIGGSAGDSLRGGTGSDVLIGNSGNDMIIPGPGGVDWVDGGAGIDQAWIHREYLTESYLFVASAAASASGLSLSDGLYVQNVEDVLLWTGSGNDELRYDLGAAGKYIWDAGAGSDKLVADFSAAVVPVLLDGYLAITGQAEAIVSFSHVERFAVTGGGAADLLVGASSADVLNGNGGADSLVGKEGGDTLNGGDGNDLLNGGAGNDTLVGGAGADTALYLGSRSNYSIAAVGGGFQITDLRAGPPDGVDTLSSMEIAQFSDDTIQLASIVSTNGDDFVTGDAGANNLAGGLGNDTYNVNNPGDVVSEAQGEGTDTVQTNLSSYALPANVENLNYIGAGAFVGSGNALANVINGGPAGDLFYAGAGDDAVMGNAGADVAVLEDGNDTAFLGTGNDYAYSGAGSDTIYGNEGIDVLLGEAGADNLNGGADQDYLFGGDGDDALSGEDFVDVLLGGAGNDTMIGGDGGDYFYGEDGNDTGNGGDGNDIFVMAAGNDTANGDDGQDYFYMGDGDDIMFGGAGVDVMQGEAGNDTFDGGADVNYLLLGPGGAGDNDTVIMRPDSGVNVIYNFEAGGANDVIRLVGTALTSFAKVQAAITDFTAAGQFCVLTLDGDTNIWLIGIAPGQLTASDFVFA